MKSSRLRNQRGSAILFSVFLMSLLLFIALEISKDTLVEYQGSMNAVKRVQAFYAAKACTELSLLRIKAYQQATRTIGKQIPDPSLLDIIWQFPLAWPIAAPAEVSIAGQTDIANATKASIFKHKFSGTITSEGGKIDINDLASPSETIRKKTRQQILDVFQAEIRLQTPFSKRYYNFRFEDLLNHMQDWIDPDRQSLMGGDESSYYREMRSTYVPPNQPFKTMEELHMVYMMEDEIYDLLVPKLTLFGGKGINVNYAAKDMLMAIDPGITSEVADKIIERRDDIQLGGLFKDEKDFFGFIGGYGINTGNFNEEKIPLYYDYEINFNINCIGLVGNINRKIDSVVYDYQKVSNRLKKSLTSDAPANPDPSDPSQQCAGKENDEKYQCLCQSKTVPAEKTKCINDKKKADEKAKQDESSEAAMPAGAPYIIFQDVK